MDKKTLVKKIVVAIIGLAAIGIALTVISPYLFKTTETAVKSPNEALEEFIKSTVREDFQPSEYRVAEDESEMVRFGFGRRYANHYSMSWRQNDSSFLVFVGYDKERSDQLVGYTLTIYVKGVIPKGPDMTRIYLGDAPEKGWIQGKPKSLPGFTSEISNVLWKEHQDKLFLSVLSLIYNEPNPGYFPEEAIKEVSMISLRIYKPNTLHYDHAEGIQQSEHELYGE